MQKFTAVRKGIAGYSRLISFNSCFLAISHGMSGHVRALRKGFGMSRVGLFDSSPEDVFLYDLEFGSSINTHTHNIVIHCRYAHSINLSRTFQDTAKQLHATQLLSCFFFRTWSRKCGKENARNNPGTHRDTE